MFATQVLNDTHHEDKENDDNSFEVVGFIVTDDKRHEIKKGENKIGRDPAVCSVVVDNHTVSKLHAVIESEGRDDTFIYDVGSTNQTKLGKKCLKAHYRYKLDNGSIIMLGNVAVKYVFYPDEDDSLQMSKEPTPPLSDKTSNLGSNLGDIFDVPTQVNVPQVTTFQELNKFEKLPDNFQVFKLPKLLSSKNGKNEKNDCLDIPESCFDAVTQCQLSSNLSKTVENHFIEDSNIFSLSTQCQITQPFSENLTDSNKIVPEGGGKVDREITSLLDDGQDDVFCTVMSINAADGQGQSGLCKPIVIKTEPEEEAILNEADAPTQVTPQAICTVEEEIEKLKQDLKLNESFEEDFYSNDHQELSLQTSAKLDNQMLTNEKEASSHGNETENEQLLKPQEHNPSEGLKPTSPSNLVSNNEADDGNETDAESFLEVTLEDNSYQEMPDLNDDINAAQRVTPFEGDVCDDLLFNTALDKNHEIVFSQTKDSVGANRSKEEIERKSFIVQESSDDTESYLEITIEDLNDDYNSKEALVNLKNEEKDKNEKKGAGSDMLEKQTDVNQEPNEANTGLQASEEGDVDSQDFISTQATDNAILRSTPIKVKTQNPFVRTLSETSQKDLSLVPSCSKNVLLERFINSQMVCAKVDDSQDTEIIEATEINSRVLPRDILKQEYKGHVEHKNPVKVPESFAADSSGDETESDLEINLDLSKNKKLLSDLDKVENVKVNRSKGSDRSNQSASFLLKGNDYTESSYVFQIDAEIEGKEVDELQGKNSEIIERKECSAGIKRQSQVSDSDETDCEEVEAARAEIKLRLTFEETQNLAPSLTKKSVSDSWVTFGGNSKPETTNAVFENDSNRSWSPLSLEMPSTQDIESTLQKILKRKGEQTAVPTEPDCPTSPKVPKIDAAPEIGSVAKEKHSERDTKIVFNSPAKRIRGKDSVSEVPVKKSKTTINRSSSDTKVLGFSLKNSQRQLSKLWETHDIAHIKPNRTRNSARNNETESKMANFFENSFSKEPTPRRNSCSKRERGRKKKCDTTPSIIKKVEEAKKLFQGGRKKDIQAVEEKPSSEISTVTRILRSARKNSGINLQSFDSPVTSQLNKNSRLRRNSKAKSSDFDGSCLNIVFTGFECESLEKVICKLGGTKINELPGSHVVVTDKVRRTVKFLCAIGLGLPITSPRWLLASRDANKFLNPWNYILKDEESEDKWDFDLKASLEQSKRKKLLEGFNVFATKNTKPPVKDLLAIVECCGGTPILTPPEVWPRKTIVVSCPEDEGSWPLSKLRSVTIVHYECILSGVLRQKIDLKTYKLR